MDSGPKLPGWVAELGRRKVFRVAAVYLVVAWVVVQVADAVFEPMGLPQWSLRLVIVLAGLGFPVACALAWAFDVTPRGIERTPAAAPEAAAGTAPVARERTAAPADVADSVAILPFSDMSPERDQEYFCDGIAEEIINSLCCVRGLHVASRTSSFQFKGRAADVREIGQVLGTSAVLEGSVRKAGSRVRITAQLVSTKDGYHLWSKSYDRELSDVFAIQTEIAREMVGALRVSLGPGERELIQRRGTSNAEAYDLYLRGQAQLREGSDTATVLAAQYFRRAIARDERFAQAHAGLANALALKGLWRIAMTSEDFDEAFAAGRRALELEPRMPEAYLAQAMLESLRGRVKEANESFEEAIGLNPVFFDAYYSYARHAFQSGDFERSLELFEKASELRPDDYLPLCMQEGPLLRLGLVERHRETAERAWQAVERHLAMDPNDGRALQLGTVQAARLGYRERARDLAQRVLALRPDAFATYYNVACAYSVIGDSDAAFAMLDKALEHGQGNLEWIGHDPDFDSIRGDPRFAAFVERISGA
jgi:adenylate cyclase